MAHSEFTYSPLDYSTDVIRLIRLFRGSDGNPIRCELFQALLHKIEGVPYEALSYTWSSSLLSTYDKFLHYKNQRSSFSPAEEPLVYRDYKRLRAFDASYSSQDRVVKITVGGRTMMVGQNLYRALCCMRQPDQDTIWWIDAMCIDQNNDREKGHQVKQMRDIYAKAERVHIWLGPSSPDIDLLMDQMIQLDKRVVKSADYRRTSPDAWLKEWPVFIQQMEAGGVNQDFNIRRRDALVDLLLRPWFGRVWIIQEAFNASTAVIRCGKKTIPTRTFVIMPRLLDVQVDPHVQAVLDIMPGYLRATSWWQNRPDLRTLLEKFHNSVATDQRDRIYALLGIASDAGSHDILQPDSYQSDLYKTIEMTVHYLLFGQVVNEAAFPLPLWEFDSLSSNLANLPGTVLFWALEQGFEQTAIQVLTRTSIDVNKPMITGQPVPLIFLARQQVFTSTMEALLSRHDVDVNIRSGSEGESPLSIAARDGNTTMVKLLLGRPDIDLYQTDFLGRSPLELVARKGDLATFSLMLAHPNFQSSSSRSGVLASTPLVLAAERGWKEQVQDIVKKRNPLEPTVRNAALYVATSNGHTDVVEFLLDQGADINAFSAIWPMGHVPGATALSIAARNGHFNLVSLFLGRNIKSHSPIETVSTELGNSITFDLNLSMALVEACRNGHTSMAQMLLDSGADADAVFLTSQKDPISALWIACKNGHVELVELLCCNVKVQVNLPLAQHFPSPLWIACWEKHEKIVRVLLEHGADPKIEAAYWELKTGVRSVEWVAQYTRHRGVWEMLLKARAKIDNVPLWIACTHGEVATLQALLDAGGDIETKDWDGRPLLWMAAYLGKTEVVRLLIERDADVKALGTSGGLGPCTPQVAAEMGGYFTVAQMLKEAAAGKSGLRAGRF